MQLRLRPKTPSAFSFSRYSVKIILIILTIFVAIFFLGRLEIPAPKKLIEQNISNDKLIKLK